MRETMRFVGHQRLWQRTVMLLLVMVLLLMPAQAWAATAADKQQALYKEVFDLISTQHVSGEVLKASDYASIEELIAALHDPYTTYLSEAQMKQFMQALDMNYVGVGMRIGEEENGFVVVEVFEGSPAEEAGVKRGDFITGINGSPTKVLTLDQLTSSVRGPSGTAVTLTLQQGDESRTVKVTRKAIQLPVVTGAIIGDIGYVAVTSFSEDAGQQFAAAVAELKKQNVTGLVLDLRDNPGGILDTARVIAKQFISEGVLIHTKDRRAEDKPVFVHNGSTVPFKVTLLVNEHSASASEVLAGALQDYGKATIVGTKTFGKGSVQSLFQLKAGGVLKVTVQEYFTPQNRPVNKVGIEPDIVVEGVIPQLITAFREAGMNDLHLEMNKHSYMLNGLEFFDEVPMVTLDDHTFVQARTLAALIGQPLQWNADSFGVDIGTDAQLHQFAADDGFRIEDGVGFIELEAFQKQYPFVETAARENGIVLTMKGTSR